MAYIEILGKDHYINKYDELWTHTIMRIENAKKAAKSDEDFAKKMITRMKRITNREKLVYAIAALKEYGYYDLVEIYESTILMDLLIGEGF